MKRYFDGNVLFPKAMQVGRRIPEITCDVGITASPDISVFNPLPAVERVKMFLPAHPVPQ